MAGWLNRILRLKGPSQPPRTCAAEPVGPIFEPLEDRRLLSGDVVATLNGDTLTLIGDNDSNRITITGDVAGVTVDAFADDLTPTTINGVAGPAVFVGVANVVYKSKDGSDYVACETLELTGDVNVKMNKGFDTFDFFDVTIGGNAKVKTGKNADSVLVYGESTFTGNLIINTGGGNNHAQFHTEAGTDLIIANGNTKVIMGNGPSNFTAYAGADGTLFNNLTVKSGNFADELSLAGLVISGKLNVNSRGGDDIISVEGLQVDGRTQIIAGADDDIIDVAELNALNLVRIKLNSGIDVASIDAGTGPILALHIIGDAADEATTDGNILTEPRYLGGISAEDDG